MDIITADVAKKYIILGNVTDTKSPVFKAYQEATQRGLLQAEYRQRAGKDWVGYPNRTPPTLPYLGNGAKLGDLMTLKSEWGYWTCGAGSSSCETQPVEMQAQVVSVDAPRVLVVRSVMSPEEAGLIMSEAEPQLTDGTVGSGDVAFKSVSRNSKLVFLPWTSTYLKHIQRRMADILGIPMDQLAPRSEALQVVEYKVNQLYQPHIDAGASRARSRFLTLLVVFKPAEDGGCTSFPRAYGRKGLTVCLNVGDAVLFYSLLPDGNIDADSVHSGDVVHKGVKWVGNLWVSDDPAEDEREAREAMRAVEI